MPPIIKMENCSICGRCSDICPEDVFLMTENGPQVAYPEECWYCGACVMDCPTSAIKMRFPPAIRVSVLKGNRL